jgi:hypothetical protein
MFVYTATSILKIFYDVTVMAQIKQKRIKKQQRSLYISKEADWNFGLRKHVYEWLPQHS